MYEENLSMSSERIFEIIAEQLNANREDLTEATVLTEELGADSLDLFQIIMALEEEYLAHAWKHE